jgi:hypothetical protein
MTPQVSSKQESKTKTVYWNIKTKLMSSTQCKDTKSYEHVNEHTTGRNILTENYHTQQENADSIKLQINLVSDILLGFISLLNEVVSLSFCKVERSRFRFENRLDLKVSCFLQNNRKCSSSSILLQSEHNLKFLQSFGLKYLPFSISNVCALILNFVKFFTMDFNKFRSK